MTNLTRKQQQILAFLQQHHAEFPHPPTLDELCHALGLVSRGSLHRHIQALVEAGLVEAMQGKRRGVRLTAAAGGDELPYIGAIAAGQPIEALTAAETVAIPPLLRGGEHCYVLRVKGESMIDMGILDGDYVIIEPRQSAVNGEIVVALIAGEVTLKRIEQRRDATILYPENKLMQPLIYPPDAVVIQGVLVGQMRSYR
ncbi:MAG: transcriptional repressor LexA [Gammaproteobacteria bacterium]|nr:transcriptional repressor LexA [Gammaproteobacteria bacterium]